MTEQATTHQTPTEQVATQQALTVSVNGTQRAVSHGETLSRLVSELTGRQLDDSGSPADGTPLGIAVAVDGVIVPRSSWARHTLASNQAIDIVTAVQGG